VCQRSLSQIITAWDKFSDEETEIVWSVCNLVNVITLIDDSALHNIEPLHLRCY